MQKDFKTGLLVGALAVIAVTIWLCTRPKLSVADRAHIVAPNTHPVRRGQAASPPSGRAEFASSKLDNPAITQVTAKSPDPEKSARIHVVQSGDTLSAISEKYYASPVQWQKIFSANDNIIKDPARLTPGARLVIPE